MGNASNLAALALAVTVDTSGNVSSNNNFTGKNKFSKQVSSPQISLGNLGATPALDFSTGNNFSGVANANFTLPLPTNMVPGQAGSIEIQQDATGSRTITYASGWIFAGGARPALSTAANAIDVISFLVRSNGTQIEATLNAGFA